MSLSAPNDFQSRGVYEGISVVFTRQSARRRLSAFVSRSDERERGDERKILFYVETRTRSSKSSNTCERPENHRRSEIVAQAPGVPFEVSSRSHHYLTIERDTWLALGVGLAVSIIVMSIAFDVKTALAARRRWLSSRRSSSAPPSRRSPGRLV